MTADAWVLGSIVATAVRTVHSIYRIQWIFFVALHTPVRPMSRKEPQYRLTSLILENTSVAEAAQGQERHIYRDQASQQAGETWAFGRFTPQGISAWQRNFIIWRSQRLIGVLWYPILQSRRIFIFHKKSYSTNHSLKSTAEPGDFNFASKHAYLDILNHWISEILLFVYSGDSYSRGSRLSCWCFAWWNTDNATRNAAVAGMRVSQSSPFFLKIICPVHLHLNHSTIPYASILESK